MLFCDFYKKLKKAMGDAEFGKLPPDKGSKYQKIFMLMTLSVNDKSNGDYLRTYTNLLKHLKKTFIKLKNDLENLKDSLHELKKEAISLDSLKDRIIIYSTIKDKDILSLPSGPIKDKERAKTSLNNAILKNIFKDIHKDIFKAINEVGLDKITQESESLEQLLKSEFHKACSDKNLMDTHINPHIGTLKDNFIKSFKNYRILIDSILPEDNRRVAINIKDNDSCINGLVDVINKDINAIDSSEFNKVVAEVEEEERRAEEEACKRVAKRKKEAKEADEKVKKAATTWNKEIDLKTAAECTSEEKEEVKKAAEELIRKAREEAKRAEEEYKRMAEKCKKFEDLFNENDIRRYSKYLEFYLKNDFPDYSDISDREIKEYVNYLYFWLNKHKDETFKKYCQGDSISNFAKEITPYLDLVSRPYFIDVINNLPAEQKKKVYKEFNAEITTVSLDDSLDSLDFLGEELSALLKKIIGEAKNKALQKDLIILEKLWEKEENDFLEMVLYPILYDLTGPDSATYLARYSFCLKILNEKIAVVKENHPDTFLDNLFFFIAKKKKIFCNFKLNHIQPNQVHLGGVICKETTLDEIYGNKNENKNKNENENENKTVLSCGRGPLMFDLSNFFTEEKNNKASFTDLKQILKFKKTLKNNSLYDYDDSFVLIDLTRALVEYVKKNKNKIGRNLHYVNPKRYWEQERFWEEKRTSELYKYIEEKLKTEEAPSHISIPHFPFQRLPFQSLRNYYVQGKCPVSLSLFDLMDMNGYPVKGS